MSTKKSKETKAFPLSDILRDLALIRSSGLDLATLIPNSQAANDPRPAASIDKSVDLSYEFVTEARKTIAISSKGSVDAMGEGIEGLRGKLDDVSKGLA